jgi:hypothetical protein
MGRAGLETSDQVSEGEAKLIVCPSSGYPARLNAMPRISSFYGL